MKSNGLNNWIDKNQIVKVQCFCVIDDGISTGISNEGVRKR